MKRSLQLLVLLLLTSAVHAKKPAEGISTPDSIFKRSQYAYAHLTTYLDSGKLIQSFSNVAYPHKDAKVFKTAYTSTGDFNFEYYETGKSYSLYTINRTANVVKTWWGVTQKITSPVKLSTPLSTAVGVSSGLSTMIPVLLLTADFNERLNIYHTIKNPVLNADEVVNGIPCYKISGSELRSEKSKMIIWIAKTDFLIRKIETEYEVDPVKQKAAGQRLDSLVRSKHLNDPEYLKRDSIRTAENKKVQDQVNAIIPNFNQTTFTVNAVYVYFPYTLAKPNPELFSFRPNREVAL